MKICESANNLTKSFSRLSLETRETGLVDIVDMKWNSPAASNVQQFKDIYNSRLQQFERVLIHPEITPIAHISEKKKYTVRGIVKRIQFSRVRAFEKKFHSKYDNDNLIYDTLDELQIEDKTGKIKFIINKQTIHNIPGCGQLASSDIPYGVCLLLTGLFVKHSNVLKVKEIIIPEVISQPSFQLNYSNSDGVAFKDKKIMVASEPTVEVLQRLKTIINHTSYEALSICALVIVGGINMKTQQILQMGRFIQEVKGSIDVFIMPSTGSQRHKLFPLRPYNGLFFLKSQQEIGLCSNPQLFQAQNGFSIHISCGQNVKDFMRNSSLSKREVQVMEMMLRFGHYCPTSPFSLKTQPFNQDYLVVQQLPHVMISGKGSSFEAKIVTFGEKKEVLLVSVPERGIAVVGLSGNYCKQLLV